MIHVYFFLAVALASGPAWAGSVGGAGPEGGSMHAGGDLPDVGIPVGMFDMEAEANKMKAVCTFSVAPCLSLPCSPAHPQGGLAGEWLFTFPSGSVKILNFGPLTDAGVTFYSEWMMPADFKRALMREASVCRPTS